MMEAAHTSETSVDIQLRTRQYIPDDSELQLTLTSFISIYSNLNEFTAVNNLVAVVTMEHKQSKPTV
jgi:hypothetical protein